MKYVQLSPPFGSFTKFWTFLCLQIANVCRFEALILCFALVICSFYYQLVNMKSMNFLHRNCRNAIYPQSGVLRSQVPDSLVSWSEKFTEYLPQFYESSSLAGKAWADPSIGNKFHITSIEINKNSDEFDCIYR